MERKIKFNCLTFLRVLPLFNVVNSQVCQEGFEISTGSSGHDIHRTKMY